tara:strand:+ start:522 stop:821 length:300 start_codon:yes stop_codon:yes gene_type:complete
MKSLLSSPIFLTIYGWISWYFAIIFFEEIDTQRNEVDTNLEGFYFVATISLWFLSILINLLLYRRLKKGNYKKIKKNIFLFINVIFSLALLSGFPLFIS